MNKFLRDVAGAFGFAMSVVVLTDGADLLDPSHPLSWSTLVAGGLAIARAGVAAGFKAVLPLVLARREQA